MPGTVLGPIDIATNKTNFLSFHGAHNQTGRSNNVWTSKYTVCQMSVSSIEKNKAK